MVHLTLINSEFVKVAVKNYIVFEVFLGCVAFFVLNKILFYIHKSKVPKDKY